MSTGNRDRKCIQCEHFLDWDTIFGSQRRHQLFERVKYFSSQIPLLRELTSNAYFLWLNIKNQYFKLPV